MYNVQDWLSSNSFIDYPEGSNNSNSTTNLLPTFADVFSVVPPKEHEVPVRPAITLLQRDDNIRKKITIDNNQDNINKKISTATAANGCVEISSCTYRRKSINNNYELNCVGLTKSTKQRLENLMDELKTTELAGIIIDYVMVNIYYIQIELNQRLCNVFGTTESCRNFHKNEVNGIDHYPT